MLKCENVSMCYGKKQVLQDVTFEAAKRRITVLLGRNGSGKSTLIRGLTGMNLYTGSLLLAGEEVRSLLPRDRARKASVLPQILPDTPLTVEMLCALGRNPYVNAWGRLNQEDHRQIEKAMEDAGVKVWRGRPCSELSGGERQRAFLAMLLSQNAPFLILDEPATYLDVSVREQMYDLIRRLVREQEKTVLLVTHDLNDAVRVADDMVILEKGRVIYTGTKEMCVAEGVLEQVFHVNCYAGKCGEKKALFFG